jgi:hypothetical protein
MTTIATTTRRAPGLGRAKAVDLRSRRSRGKGSVRSMFKMRVALLGVLALVITSGIMTSAASASPSWKVNGTKLGAQVKKPVKIIAGVTELKGKVVLEASTIICGKAVVENAYIEGNGAGAGQSGTTGITFSKCENKGPTNCVINEPITTKQLKSHLVTYGEGQEKIGEIFEPSQGTEFVSISFKNGEKTCSTPGPFPVKGKVASEIKPEGKEVKIGELAFPSPFIKTVKLEGQTVEPKLSIGENPSATFSGKFEAELVSEEVFGASF